jgi:hypothetical protein
MLEVGKCTGAGGGAGGGIVLVSQSSGSDANLCAEGSKLIQHDVAGHRSALVCRAHKIPDSDPNPWTPTFLIEALCFPQSPKKKY